MAKANIKRTKQSPASVSTGKKKHKGRNYYATVGGSKNASNNPTTHKKGQKKKDDENRIIKKERKEYEIGEKWSKAKKKRMRKVLAKRRLGSSEKGEEELANTTSDFNELIQENQPAFKKLKQTKNKTESFQGENVPQKSNSNEKYKEKQVSKPAPAPAPPKEKKETKLLFGGSKSSAKMSDLQQAFLDRLSGSRFRILNEELYTKPSNESLERFQSNPDLFQQYHDGFRTQVLQWPVNPVDQILEWILAYTKRNKNKTKKHPQKQRNKRKTKDKTEKKPSSDEQNNNDSWIVADFGCGDAKLAQEIVSKNYNLNDNDESNHDNDESNHDNDESNHDKSMTTDKTDNTKQIINKIKVHSFDLVSGGNPLVTACDMANVPLPNDCVDIAVFSLALMGTNVADFIREAHRVMRSDGVLKIAEVRSRFESTHEKDESKKSSKKNHGANTKKPNMTASESGENEAGVDQSSLTQFVAVMGQLGFICKKMDRSNQMFVMFDFEKNGQKPKRDIQLTLRPCIYKRR